MYGYENQFLDHMAVVASRGFELQLKLTISHIIQLTSGFWTQFVVSNYKYDTLHESPVWSSF